MQLPIKKLNLLISGTIVLSILVQCISLFFFTKDTNNLVLFSLLWLPLFVCLCLGEGARTMLKESITTIDFSWVAKGFLAGFLLLGLEQVTLILWKLGEFNAAQYTIYALAQMIEPEGIRLLLGSQPQSYWFFTMNLVITLVFSGVFFTLVFVLGFELVWRGIILPELMSLFGVRKLPLIIGVIMSLCFIPFNLSGGMSVESPYLTAFIFFPLLCIGANYILVYLCLNRVSVWPSAFALGTYFVGSESMVMLATDAESNLIAKGIFLGLSVLWVRSFLNDYSEQEDNMQKEKLETEQHAIPV